MADLLTSLPGDIPGLLLRGQRVRFRVEDAFDPILGTVRDVGRDQARCDDGKPENPDMYTNGFRWSAWVDSHDLEVVS